MGTHISIDPDTRIIDILTAPIAGISTLEMRREIYSEAKEDWLSDANLRKLRFPFRDPITAFVGDVQIGPFVFLANDDGWRIRPYDADHELTINGDFVAIDSTIPMFLPRTGRTIIVNIILSARTQTLLIDSGTGPWTENEKAQIRYVLGVDGTKSATGTTAELINMILDEALSSHVVPDSLSLHVQQANAMLIRMLGLQKENSFIDNTEHDANKQITKARVRVFDSKENVEAAEDGDDYSDGLLETYTAYTSWKSIGELGSYRLVRE